MYVYSQLWSAFIPIDRDISSDMTASFNIVKKDYTDIAKPVVECKSSFTQLIVPTDLDLSSIYITYVTEFLSQGSDRIVTI